MLNALREGASTWVVRIFLMVLVASFAVWGIGDIFRARSTSGVITVGERDVGANEVAAAFNRDLRRLQSQLGPQFDAQQARDMGLLQNTVRQIVARSLFDEATRELGLTVPDEALAREVRENPAFKDEFGRFDRFRFESLLRENGFSEERFLEATRRDMTRAQLLDSITVAVPAPAAMVEAYYRFQQERRVAEVLRLPDTALAEVPAPDEEALKAYHQAHAARYTAPEYRAISFFTLSPSDLADEVSVSEEELQEAYKDRLDQFSVVARREVAQILVDNEDEAKKIAAAIAAGTDFEAAANEFTGEPPTDLGGISPTTLPLPQPAVEAIFALPEDGVSAPLESDLGWHLFRVARILAVASTKKFDEVHDDLERQLRLERASELMFESANRIEDSLAAGDSVEEVVQRFGLTLTRVPAIDQRGADRAGNAVPDIPAGPRFLEVTFEERVGDEPRLIESDTGNYFLVRVDEVTDPAIRPLDEVRAAVITDWTDEQRTELAQAHVAELAEKARGGTALATLKAEAGAGETTTTDALLRADFVNQAGLSQELVTALFKARPGEVVVGANAPGNARVIARLVEVKDAAISDAPEALEQLRELVRQAMAEDLRSQFQYALSKNFEVSVNEPAINAIFDQSVR